MKGAPVISNFDEIVLINQNLSKKIYYLEMEKQKSSAYQKDIEQSLALNKQSLSQLAIGNNERAILKLNQENMTLHAKISQYYSSNLDLCGQLLIESQLRNEQRKSFGSRLVQFENIISQLRKYLQDKEDSVSAIMSRLKKYEDLNEITLESKIEGFKHEFAENTLSGIINQICSERDKYKQVYEQFNINLNQLSFLKNCLEDGKKYAELKQAYENFLKNHTDGQKSSKFLSLCQREKTTAIQSSISLHNRDKVDPNRELIKLLKKQKLNNEILEQALNDAIEKNQQLILENDQLIKAHIQFEKYAERLECQLILMEKQLSIYDSNYKKKMKWNGKRYDRMSQRSIDIQKLNNQDVVLEARGDEEQVHLETLKYDVEKMSHFIMTCVPGKRVKKSLSSYTSSNKFSDGGIEVLEEGEYQIEEIM